ncbi:MAG: hypothetical protein A2Y14_01180 [Verrucomicrobia bacterium GWF2_51_19]|nr:MAG: hypothetical protein A2Y14_01180 [Verrucomicrobia bacterium GWF2_51_19]HCJ12606.1 hypothetical protein [Opitutae bacterium]
MTLKNLWIFLLTVCCAYTTAFGNPKSEREVILENRIKVLQNHEHGILISLLLDIGLGKKEDIDDVDYPLDNKGNTALHYAVIYNDRVAVYILRYFWVNVEKENKPKDNDKKGKTPKELAIEKYGKDAAIVKDFERTIPLIIKSSELLDKPEQTLDTLLSYMEKYLPIQAYETTEEPQRTLLDKILLERSKDLAKLNLIEDTDSEEGLGRVYPSIGGINFDDDLLEEKPVRVL